MKKLRLVAGLLTSQSALAHVSYSGRDFGSFDGLSNQSVTIANQATRSYSWADAADADWGHTHTGKWFTFTLTNDALVTISASALANATATSVGGLLLGFSLYAGKAPAAAYDATDVTLAYRNTLGFKTEGVSSGKKPGWSLPWKTCSTAPICYHSAAHMLRRATP